MTLRLTLLAALVCAAYLPAIRAQYDDRESIDPAATQYTVDVPVVLPGGPALAEPVALPPEDAVVLFDGSDLSAWVNVRGEDAHWTVADGVLTVDPGAIPYPPGGDIMTRDSFANFQLHLEFRTPAVVEGEGQGRGNSGIFLQGRYELQILDSYDNPTYSNGQLGSIYKQSPPLANPARRPGEWQTYDVIYTAPVWSESGTLLHPAYVTAMLNGVLVQNHFPIWGPTEYKGLPVYPAPHGAAPIKLQDHGNPTSFRNIWLRPL